MNEKNILFKILIFFRIDRIINFLNRKKLIILAYHGFTETNSSGAENYLGLHIDKEAFRRQIKYLKKNYKIITLYEAIDIIKNKKEFPKNTVVLTADDGYQSNYTLAYPVLKELSVPMTIFITTNFVDNKEFLWTDKLEFAVNNTMTERLVIIIDKIDYKLSLKDVKLKINSLEKIKRKLKQLSNDYRVSVIEEIEDKLKIKLNQDNAPELYKPLSWNEIKEMQDSGLVDIGSHTHTHLILSQCGSKQIYDELSSSKKLIAEKLQIKTKLFAYPNGQAKDFNKEVVDNLKKLGYECAVSTMYGRNNINSDLFTLKRYYSSSAMDLTEFKIILGGISSFLKKLKSKL